METNDTAFHELDLKITGKKGIIKQIESIVCCIFN
jgi:hypothetical protein